MLVVRSPKNKPKGADAALASMLAAVSETNLRQFVATLAVPRHFRTTPLANRQAAQFICRQLQQCGYRVAYQGAYLNVLALPAQDFAAPLLLVGAHYDSVPGTPGADDNASAVAVLLEAARVLSQHALSLPVCFAAFNCEEDGLLGSADFVAHYLPGSGLTIKAAHILEMVGYCTRAPHSQSLPPGLPIRVPTTGDFLGLIGNRDSNNIVADVIAQAARYVPELEFVGLKLYLGAERLVPDLLRSDHAPFWQAGIPAVLWTDTSEFRNPHYHRSGDTPETLDYEFMTAVTRALLAVICR